MTPLEIGIALHYHCRIDDYGLGNGDNNHCRPVVQEILKRFCAEGVLQTGDPGYTKYKAGPALPALVERLCNADKFADSQTVMAHDVDVTALIRDISGMVVNSTVCGQWKRLRYAVTSREYEALRAYCLKQYGYFFSRVRGVALQVEEHPEHCLACDHGVYVQNFRKPTNSMSEGGATSEKKE